VLQLERRRLIDWWLGKAQIAVAIGITAFAATLKANPADLGVFGPITSWMQNWAWIIGLSGPFAIGLMQVCRRHFGSPWAWEAIQKILDEFRNDVFKGFDDPDDHHRATLFQYKCFTNSLDPRNTSGCLIAVGRSGHLTKERITRFKAPDDGEKCEGVVGYAWRHTSWVRVPSYGPLLPLLEKSSNSGDIKMYAEHCHVSLEKLRSKVAKGRPLARSYAALRVQLKGKPWGVLVLDSRNSKPFEIERLERFKAYGSLLTPVLERI